MTKEPTYDGGHYCVEYMEEGKWRKKKTGKFLARNWNHITLGYAIHQYIRETRLGNASRIIYEPTKRTVADNLYLCITPVAKAWSDRLRETQELIQKQEKNRIPAND